MKSLSNIGKKNASRFYSSALNDSLCALLYSIKIE